MSAGGGVAMTSGTAGSVHLLGPRLNLAHVWEASRRDLLRVLGPGDSKVSSHNLALPAAAHPNVGASF